MNGRIITEEMIQEALAYNVPRKDAERGYYISISDYGNGASHIQRIDAMDIFSGDWEAAAQAEKDGIKIIRDMLLPYEHNAPYIDTPENRFLLKPLEEIAIKELRRRENTCDKIDELIKDASDKEQIALFNSSALNARLNDVVFIVVQSSDSGYDYSLYNRSYQLVDGGQLDEPELSMAEAFYEVLSDIGAIYSTLVLYDYDKLMDNEASNQTANYLKEIEELKVQ